MADILAVPLKKTSEVDLIKPLKNVIALRFSTADNPEDFGEAIVELNKLRNNANIRALDKQESSLEILARFLLHSIEISICYHVCSKVMRRWLMSAWCCNVLLLNSSPR